MQSAVNTENAVPQYFYAYHSYKNNSVFEPSSGYGVSSESKRDNVKVGDLVFVIQKIEESAPFELCGPYEVAEHYNRDSGDNRYRVRLVEVRAESAPITIDEEAVSQKLPQLNSYQNWTNFKRHFCRQGGSLQQPLSPAVVDVLNELVRSSETTNYQAPMMLQDLEVAFQDEVKKSKSRTSEERRLRLAKARKTPETKMVLVKTFTRNPDVVAEALHLADGFCGNCGKEAPFCRRSDGSMYLEVHHKVHLAQGGEDTLENSIALCPNCHRKMHYGV